eukprot:jgi/Astpho2/8576/Aster-x1530
MRKKNQLLQSKLQALQDAKAAKRKLKVLKWQLELQRAKRVLEAAQQEHEQLLGAAKQEYLESRRVAQNAAKAAQLNNDLHSLEAEMSRLNLKLWTQAPDWERRTTKWGPPVKTEQITYRVQDNQVMLADRHTFTVLLFDQPFAVGACRMAYHAMGQKDGQRYVVKHSLRSGADLDADIREMEGDVCANSARHLAAEFNGALMKSGTTAQLSYQEVSILLLPDPSAPSGKKVLFMEPYLEGGFTKFHSNDGTISHPEPCLQAFSHWTWHYWAQAAHPEEAVVVDLQGIKKGTHEFLLTDPAIHTCNSRRSYGDTNRQQRGIKEFFASHKCGLLCTQLGLPQL